MFFSAMRFQQSCICLLFPLLFHSFSFAQKGKDGAKTITGQESVNEYTFLTADAAAGSTSLTVDNSSLNSNGRFSGNLLSGDLILIIQMQGAGINPNTADSTWGEITNYNNCGLYEFAEVGSVPNANTIETECPIRNNYTASGKVQIIRVPRFTSLSITNAGTLWCTDPWDGNSGGIVVAEINGNTIIDGSIEASGTGFRGGQVDGTSLNSFVISSINGDDGAEKGESIAGFQADYDVVGGRFSKGAPANGGGGGGAHNAGGGGGANGGNPANWNGYGIPDNSDPNWSIAWNLEFPGMSGNTSSGGGRGGYDYSFLEADALVNPPGDPIWGSATNNRKVQGGFGGRPLDYSGGRIFLGGGGGAGDRNQTHGTAGANGGGMVYLLSYGTISGSGQIIANGDSAQDVCCLSTATDAPGGGGAGGTVILNSTGNISGIEIIANGGRGGDQLMNSIATEAEGPGGGGGGGYIAISNGTIARQALGARNGITEANTVSEFIPNGATAGAEGTINGVIIDFTSPVSMSTQDTSICAGQAITLSATVNPSSTLIHWFDTRNANNTIDYGATYTTPVITKDTIFYVGICPDIVLDSIIVTVTNSAIADYTASSACINTNIQFNDSSSGTINSYQWDFGDGQTASVQNPSHSYSTAGTYDVKLLINAGESCSDSITQQIIITDQPSVDFMAPPVCLNNPTNFTDMSIISTDSITSWQWDFGEPSSGNNNHSTLETATHTYANAGAYNVQLIAAASGGCADTITKTVNINPLPTAHFRATFPCFGDSSNFTNLSSIPGGDVISWAWNFDDIASGANNLSNAEHPSHLFSASGTYNIILTVTSDSGCQSTVSIPVTISDAPTAAFQPTLACIGQPTCFSDASSIGVGSIDSWLWDFGDGNVSADQNPCYTFLDTGAHSVQLTVSSGNCKDSISVITAQLPSPIADFSLTSNRASVLESSIEISDRSLEGTLGWWSFGDGDSLLYSPDSSVIHHIYPDENPGGTYTITLTLNNNGCSSSVSKTVIIEPYWTFYIPNAFSPNGDGLNDVFSPKAYGIDALELWIYDRWGNLMFYTDDQNIGWDGIKLNGASNLIVQQEVFSWIAEVKDPFGETHKYIGHLTMIR